MDTQKKGHVKTQGEGSHLQAKVRGLKRNQRCQHLDLGLEASKNNEKINSWHLSHLTCVTLKN
jgi:hypothetical protein